MLQRSREKIYYYKFSQGNSPRKGKPEAYSQEENCLKFGANYLGIWLLFSFLAGNLGMQLHLLMQPVVEEMWSGLIDGFNVEFIPLASRGMVVHVSHMSHYLVFSPNHQNSGTPTTVA